MNRRAVWVHKAALRLRSVGDKDNGLEEALTTTVRLMTVRTRAMMARYGLQFGVILVKTIPSMHLFRRLDSLAINKIYPDTMEIQTQCVKYSTSAKRMRRAKNALTHSSAPTEQYLTSGILFVTGGTTTTAQKRKVCTV